jgi:hypothetical protein
MFFYLVLLTSIDSPVVTELITISSTDQRTIVNVCKSTTIAMEYALLAVEACAIFLSIGLCLATMDVPDRVNETNMFAYSKSHSGLHTVSFVLTNCAD